MTENYTAPISDKAATFIGAIFGVHMNESGIRRIHLYSVLSANFTALK